MKELTTRIVGTEVQIYRDGQWQPYVPGQLLAKSILSDWVIQDLQRERDRWKQRSEQLLLVIQTATVVLAACAIIISLTVLFR